MSVVGPLPPTPSVRFLGATDHRLTYRSLAYPRNPASHSARTGPWCAKRLGSSPWKREQGHRCDLRKLSWAWPLQPPLQRIAGRRMATVLGVRWDRPHALLRWRDRQRYRSPGSILECRGQPTRAIGTSWNAGVAARGCNGGPSRCAACAWQGAWQPRQRWLTTWCPTVGTGTPSCWDSCNRCAGRATPVPSRRPRSVATTPRSMRTGGQPIRTTQPIVGGKIRSARAQPKH